MGDLSKQDCNSLLGGVCEAMVIIDAMYHIETFVFPFSCWCIVITAAGAAGLGFARPVESGNFLCRPMTDRNSSKPTRLRLCAHAQWVGIVRVGDEGENSLRK